jgi:hypothetical protein
MTNTSTLEQIIHKVWNETDLNKAKMIVKQHLEGSRIKSKDTILSNLDSIKSKSRLDSYMANSLLAFEKLKVG